MNDIARQSMLGATLLALTAGTAGAHDRYMAVSMERKGSAPYYDIAYGVAWGFESPQDAIEAAYKECRKVAHNPQDCLHGDGEPSSGNIVTNLHDKCFFIRRRTITDKRAAWQGHAHYAVSMSYNDGGAEARQSTAEVEIYGVDLDMVECHEEHAQDQ